MNDLLNPALLRDRLQEWLDQRIEIVLAQLLRAGVLASALVVIVGAVLYLGSHARERVDYQTFHAQPEQLRSGQWVAHCVSCGLTNKLTQHADGDRFFVSGAMVVVARASSSGETDGCRAATLSAVGCSRLPMPCCITGLFQNPGSLSRALCCPAT